MHTKNTENPMRP